MARATPDARSGGQLSLLVANSQRLEDDGPHPVQVMVVVLNDRFPALNRARSTWVAPYVVDAGSDGIALWGARVADQALVLCEGVPRAVVEARPEVRVRTAPSLRHGDRVAVAERATTQSRDH